MKYSVVFALAAVSQAFVVPSEEVLAKLAPAHHDSLYQEAVDAKDNIFSSIKKSFGKVSHASKDVWADISEQRSNAIDDAMNKIGHASDSVADAFHETALNAESWLEEQAATIEEEVDQQAFWRPPHRGDDEHDGPPHHGPPHHKRPHHPPHHGKPNHTVYELIASSKYTTKLAFFINQYPDLVAALNTTNANYTIFAPTDKAFERIPDHAPKPSKKELLDILSYHVVPGIFPASRVLTTYTVATALQVDHLGKDPLPQRLSFHIGLNGLTVNFYSRIIAINIFGTNGVIHGVDHVIVPPPKTLKIIDLLPNTFSTLELGLAKTGLLEKLNDTKHAGGTFFAPSNHEFAKLGPRVNAFLFSEHGLPYLTKLLEYHVVPNNTLYSDAFYSADATEEIDIPRGRFHVELPTLLKDRSLSIDIARWAGFINFRINAFARVAVKDGVASDGVIQVPDSILIPPRQVGGVEEHWNGEEEDVEEFKARFDSPLDKTDL